MLRLKRPGNDRNKVIGSNFLKATAFILFSILLIGSLAACTSTTTEKAAVPTITTATAQAATSKTSAPVVTPKSGGTLKVIYDTGPSGTIGYPPEVLGDAVTSVKPALESLLLETQDPSKFVNLLAESYQISEDRKSVIIKIRRGIKFHDGSDLNADVVKWNIDIMIPTNQIPYLKSVEIIDPYTVKLNVSQWSNILLTRLANFSNIVSKASFDKNGIDWLRQNPIGTGPYKFVSFQRDVGINYVKNTDYWQKDRPFVNGVNFLFIADTMTKQAALQAGDGDMMTSQTGSSEMINMGQKNYKLIPQLIDTSVLIPDTANADSPWANQKVREAAEYAIDREAMAKLGNGYWKAAYQIPGPDTTTYNPNFNLGRKYDPAKAKQLLTEAGYPTGFKTTIIAAPYSLNRDIVVALQQYLNKVGIVADMLYPDAAKFTAEYTNGKWKNGIVYEPIAGSTNYMRLIVFMFDPTANRHPSWARTPEWLAAYNAALAAPVPDVNLMRAVTDLMTKDALVIPVNQGGRGWVLGNYVKDSVSNTGLGDYVNAWLDK